MYSEQYMILSLTSFHSTCTTYKRHGLTWVWDWGGGRVTVLNSIYRCTDVMYH